VFTTRAIAKITNPGAVIEVHDTDDLTSLMDKAQPGDTVLLHAGNYVRNGKQIVITASGTQANPILLRPYGDGEVHVPSVVLKGNHIWLDDLNVRAPEGGDGIRAATVGNAFLTGFTLTRNTVRDSHYSINADGHECVILNNAIIGIDRAVSNEGIEFDKQTRGNVAAFNSVTEVFDAISFGHGNIDVHNNSIHNIGDNSIEPDKSWDNYRVWDNRTWDVGLDNISFQPIRGGPWYIFRNQLTGSKYNAFKMRGGFGPKFLIGNSIVSARSTQRASQLFHNRHFCQQLLEGSLNHQGAQRFARLWW
jgi:hypothetical protein